MTALILAVVAGAVVGLALGGLGGGGSVLAVPALTYLIGMEPAAAITASLIIVALTSITALTGHARDGNVAWRTGLLFAAAGIVPALLVGTAMRPPAPGRTHHRLRRRRGTRRTAHAAPRTRPGHGRGTPRQGQRGRAYLGAVTGLLGVGGGFLAVPALTRVLNLPVRRAIGTSLLVITINSLAALGARAGTGTPLDWSVIAPFTAAAVLGAWDGKRYAQRLSGDTLRRLFAYALLAVAAFMLADAFI